MSEHTYSALPKNKNETKHAALRFVKLEEVPRVFIEGTLSLMHWCITTNISSTFCK